MTSLPGELPFEHSVPRSTLALFLHLHRARATLHRVPKRPKYLPPKARCSITLSDLRLNLLTLLLSHLQVRTRTAWPDEAMPAMYRGRHGNANEHRI